MLDLSQDMKLSNKIELHSEITTKSKKIIKALLNREEQQEDDEEGGNRTSNGHLRSSLDGLSFGGNDDDVFNNHYDIDRDEEEEEDHQLSNHKTTLVSIQQGSPLVYEGDRNNTPQYAKFDDEYYGGEEKYDFEENEFRGRNLSISSIVSLISGIEEYEANTEYEKATSSYILQLAECTKRSMKNRIRNVTLMVLYFFYLKFIDLMFALFLLNFRHRFTPLPSLLAY